MKTLTYTEIKTQKTFMTKDLSHWSDEQATFEMFIKIFNDDDKFELVHSEKVSENLFLFGLKVKTENGIGIVRAKFVK